MVTTKIDPNKLNEIGYSSIFYKGNAALEKPLVTPCQENKALPNEEFNELEEARKTQRSNFWRWQNLRRTIVVKLKIREDYGKLRRQILRLEPSIIHAIQMNRWERATDQWR